MADDLNKHYEKYDYAARTPLSIDLHDLNSQQQHRLMESQTFCMLPWVHLHGYPTGQAFPCCLANDKLPVGNLRESTLEEIWNNDNLKQMRTNMMADKPCAQCERCYEQEDVGFFSLRNSANKYFGHHIVEVDKTQPDGYHPEFKLRYWDIRFSNICNFRCRYCGPNFSSNWWEDKVALNGRDQVAHEKFLYAGRDKDDIWNQMIPHIPYLEQIYFAGGEPLIMDEHYKILEELINRKLTHVRLLYNTNFSELKYKKKNVLELWRMFDSVSVGASLDGMGERAEYMRKGTKWAEIEENRKAMMEICPKVDFYISATVSVFNVLHITDFHRNWADRGLIAPQDLNINILQSPYYYRCDILPPALKEKAKVKVNDAIEWLDGKDHLNRATNGYKGIINFLDANDNRHHVADFIRVTRQLDNHRGENFRAIFPELGNINAG